MAILKVARMGHPVLRARARPIEPAQIGSPRIQQLIDDMFETMQEYQGVGLAAPQVHESLRVFVAGFAPDDEDDESARGVPLMALINPEITPIGQEIVEDWEGCLELMVPGCSGGGGTSGRSATMLYQCVGIFDSSRTTFVFVGALTLARLLTDQPWLEIRLAGRTPPRLHSRTTTTRI